MTNRSPEFFLSTAGEYEPLAAPRACWQKARLRGGGRDDHMLVEIDPALDGQRFGLGAYDVRELVLSARHRGRTLYPVSEWPLFVFVSRIVDNAIRQSLAFERDQIELIAWGELFRTLKEALDHAKKFQR